MVWNDCTDVSSSWNLLVIWMEVVRSDFPAEVFGRRRTSADLVQLGAPLEQQQMVTVPESATDGSSGSEMRDAPVRRKVENDADRNVDAFTRNESRSTRYRLHMSQYGHGHSHTAAECWSKKRSVPKSCDRSRFCKGRSEYNFHSPERQHET